MNVPSVPLIYVGFRPTYRDPMYGTGEWQRDQIKLVPPDVAAKMTRHRDVWLETQIAKKEEAGALQDPSAIEQVAAVNHPLEEQKQLEELDVLKAQIGTMDKAALRAFAESHYQQKIDGRLSTDDTRAKVIALVDQYGPQ